MMNKKDLTLKELSLLEIQVSEVRATLENLKKEEENYFNIREDETKKRIDIIFKNSVNIFNQIENNYTELRSYLQRIKDFVSNVRKLKENTLNQSLYLKLQIENGKAILDEKIDILNELQKKLKEQENSIFKSKEELEIQEKELRIEEKAIYDKRDAFERAWKDLKK